MFLSGLKEKSIIRKLKAVSNERQYAGGRGTVTRVALIQEEHTVFNPKALGVLTKMLGIPEAQLSLLTYVAQPSKEQLSDERLILQKHLGWRGIFKALHLKSFVEKPYDLLINYRLTENLVVESLVAQSAAAFKVGLETDCYGLHDLVIRVGQGQESLFIKELEKYLEILKIKN